MYENLELCSDCKQKIEAEDDRIRRGKQLKCDLCPIKINTALHKEGEEYFTNRFGHKVLCFWCYKKELENL